MPARLPLTVIIPALNEAAVIEKTIRGVQKHLKDIPHEIIVVDDGSRDQTGDIARGAGARVIRHPAPGGYGNALKSGICASRHELLAIIDADGTYPIEKLSELYDAVAEEGYHMAVGARQGRYYRGGFFKRPARKIFTFLSEFSSGRKIPDVNSGMRVFRKSEVMYFYDTLCSGFSFTTTITLAYLLKGFFIRYIPIEYYERKGKSKVRHFKDSLGSLQIIVQSIIYYNPLKIFLVLIMLLTLAAILSAIMWNFHSILSLLFFLFCCFFLLFLGMGFLGANLSFLAALMKEQGREKSEFSHFIGRLHAFSEHEHQTEK
jgi:glycosyltransferase involved in cell wall biosynthesis